MKLYLCNVMTQHGETDGLTAFDHLERIIFHTKRNIVNCCLVNSGRLRHDLLIKYAQEKSFPVIFDRERFKRKGVLIFEGDVASKSNYLRHNSQNTAKEIMNVYSYMKKRWRGLKNK